MSAQTGAAATAHTSGLRSARRGSRSARLALGQSVRLVILALGVAAIAIASICLGAISLGLDQLVDGLFGGANSFIVQQYRLPRVGIAILAGAALGLSGLMLQSAVRNPLASPDVIGVTKGAGLGALLVAIFVPPLVQGWLTSIAIIAGAALVAVVILAIAKQSRANGATLALSGIAIAALATAGMHYLMATNPDRADEALIWLAGSTYGSNAEDVVVLAVWLAACTPLVLRAASLLDVAALDEDSQSGIGVSPRSLRSFLVITSVALAAGAVAAVGGIGFLGLLAPHLARRITSARAHYLVPATALCGAALLLLADLSGRMIGLPNEIPAGIMAAIVGGPYLLFILLREARVRDK